MYHLNRDTFFKGSGQDTYDELETVKPPYVEIISSDEPLHASIVRSQTIYDFGLFVIAIQKMQKNGIMPQSPIICIAMNWNYLNQLFDVQSVPSSYNDDGILIRLKSFETYNETDLKFAKFLANMTGCRHVAIAPPCCFVAQLFGWESKHREIAIKKCQTAMELCSKYYKTKYIERAIKLLDDSFYENQQPAKCIWSDMFFKKSETDYGKITHTEVVPTTDKHPLSDNVVFNLSRYFTVHPIGTNKKYRPVNNLGHVAYHCVHEAIIELNQSIAFNNDYMRPDTEEIKNETEAVAVLKKFIAKYKKCETVNSRLAIIISETNDIKNSVSTDNTETLIYEDSVHILEFIDYKELVKFFMPYIHNGYVYVKLTEQAIGNGWDELRQSKSKFADLFCTQGNTEFQLFEIAESL
jgi:hypothetical protein